MKNIKEGVEDELLKKANVVGVGIGQKWTNGVNTGEDAIVVFVSSKKSKTALNDRDVIPDTIEGVKTDVIGRSGSFKLQNINTGRVRPLQPGYSVGHPRITAGTIGGFFLCGYNSDSVVALSNSHVLANSGRYVRRGDSIYQPGPYDGGNGGDVVGKLLYHRGLATAYGRAWNNADRHHAYGYNFEDSAVMSLNSGVEYQTNIPGIGVPRAFREEVLTVGETLHKNGRTTGYTSANVIATSMTAHVDYGFASLQFRDQIATHAMSSGGDSGSLTLDSNDNAVGLLFAGSNTVTLHNRIRYPKASYDLKIINETIVNEVFSYTLTVDGVETANSFGMNDYGSAMQEVYSLAMQGHDASISMTYSAVAEDD